MLAGPNLLLNTNFDYSPKIAPYCDYITYWPYESGEGGVSCDAGDGCGPGTVTFIGAHTYQAAKSSNVNFVLDV